MIGLIACVILGGVLPSAQCTSFNGPLFNMSVCEKTKYPEKLMDIFPQEMVSEPKMMSRHKHAVGIMLHARI